MVGCAWASPQAEEAGVLSQSITGGVETQACEWPSVVTLGGCSGTLVHPSLVLYAAHCGLAMAEVRFGTDSSLPARVAEVSHCRQYPDAQLGDGSDLAYCVLREPVLDVPPARILAGCELDALSAGAVAQIVGFGVDTTGADFGRQRAATTRIARVTTDELFLDSSESDTCRGDSGGPVFIEVASGGESTELRLAGVTSAGSSSECGQGVGHYINLASKLDWLESSSGFDVSPCFDGAEWSPTPVCSRVPGYPVCETPEPEPSSTCGEAFALAPDSEPPSLELVGLEDDSYVHRLEPGQQYLALELALRVEDEGWGVQQVVVTLLDADETALFERVDEVAPYGIQEVRVPPGTFELSVAARDHAGKSSARVVHLEVLSPVSEGAGCAVTRFSARRESAGLGLLALGMLLLARRKAREFSVGSVAPGLLRPPVRVGARARLEGHARRRLRRARAVRNAQPWRGAMAAHPSAGRNDFAGIRRRRHLPGRGSDEARTNGQ
jgi:hypothetical protein